jgi:hypothetical protein
MSFPRKRESILPEEFLEFFFYIITFAQYLADQDGAYADGL